MNFKANDKVVFVGGQVPPSEAPAEGAEAYRTIGPLFETGTVYVVDAVLGPFPNGAIGLAMVGITAISRSTGQEVGFNSRNFRLLSEVQAENAANHSNKKQNV